jgi:hypothetical protein
VPAASNPSPDPCLLCTGANLSSATYPYKYCGSMAGSPSSYYYCPNPTSRPASCLSPTTVTAGFQYCCNNGVTCYTTPSPTRLVT